MQVASAFQTARLQLVELGKLASGGMATVSLASRDGELVAVKRIHPHLAEQLDFMQMFLDEIWLSSALQHPNIVRLVGWGVDAGGPYYASEFVLGASLRELTTEARAREARWPAELVAFVGAEAAAGLHAAHRIRGPEGEPLHFVHRDISPSNILVGFDGAVKITDFGVAKVAQKSSRTETGVFKGKLSYLAPEYAREHAYDARSDLYQLGVVMFELLAGRRPFAGKSELELLRLITDESPAPRIGDVVPEVDARLAAIIDALLAKDPAARPADGASLAADLRSVIGDHDTLRDALGTFAREHGAARHSHIDALVKKQGTTLAVTSFGDERPTLSDTVEGRTAVRREGLRLGPTERRLGIGAIGALGALVGGVAMALFLVDASEPRIAPALSDFAKTIAVPEPAEPPDVQPAVPSPQPVESAPAPRTTRAMPTATRTTACTPAHYDWPRCRGSR